MFLAFKKKSSLTKHPPLFAPSHKHTKLSHSRRQGRDRGGGKEISQDPNLDRFPSIWKSLHHNNRRTHTLPGAYLSTYHHQFRAPVLPPVRGPSATRRPQGCLFFRLVPPFPTRKPVSGIHLVGFPRFTAVRIGRAKKSAVRFQTGSGNFAFLRAEFRKNPVR